MKNGARAMVIGAGLSGLTAATRLAERGVQVTLFESAGQAGGRCRSYFDPTFDGVIDNGNHLVLSGNHAIHAYLSRIGATANLSGPVHALFDFVDLKSGARWTLKPNDGPLPWWIGSAARRVPGTSPGDYAAYAKLLFAGRRKRVDEVMSCSGPLWDRLMHPFLLAALNTEPRDASARLAAAILRETLVKGGRAYRPRTATPTLAAAFIDPALEFLKGRGVKPRFNERLRAITFGGRVAAALEFTDATLPLARQDAVILAVPPWVAKDLVPKLSTPLQFRSIVNAHFKFPAPPNLLKEEGVPAILGVIGGTAEWIFSFADRISVTVSAADALVDRDRDELAEMLWADVSRALDIPAGLPRWQIVKEKRATFAATPAQDARRPAAKTSWRNFFLAGDWTDTGLPATIEGAVRSGEAAAALALRHLSL
jgi:squalene-associated FAD-dependent desaturase